ncbi:universal stress protein [Terrabacter tumescens]|uniref:Universal stress protein n=1 Tax=Terrabacter tumescens TaxID=60443 RepID=A0ABQ2I6Z7_9MICO|nr:universal stress protein [Terrabacter tumescens]GGN02377.1 universal stress protein [Terrabacter tumescens]
MDAAVSKANETTSHGIVVGYDGSPGARLALDWAVETAKRDERPLTLLHCVGLTMTPTFRAYDPGVQAQAYDEMSRGVLAEAIEIAAETLDRKEIHPLSVIGSAAAELVGVSSQADLVVTGSRGHGAISGGLLGSTSYAVTAHAHCPAVVVRGQFVVHAGPSHPVVAAFDDSKNAQKALETAIQVAVAAEAPLHVVAVDNVGGLEAWPETDTMLGREEMMEQMHRRVGETLKHVADDAERAHPGLEVQTNLLGGGAGAAIAAYAVDVKAGLVVLGSRGHGGFTGMLLGSVSHRVVHDAPCPVMVIH